LWLNDLEDLTHLLSARTSGITIRAGDAFAETVEDLVDATPRELRKVELVTTNPNIMIRLHTNRTEILSVDRQSDAQVLVDDVQGLLRARRSRLPTLREVGSAALVGIVMGTAMPAVLVLAELVRVGGTNGRPFNWGLFFGICLSVGLAFGLLAGLLSPVASLLPSDGGACHVIPEWRRDRRGISRAARREWSVAIVGAIVGATAAAIFTYLQTRAG
jgi:hypothetical protein